MTNFPPMKFLSFFAALSFASLAFAADAPVTEAFSHTYALNANGTVHLENVNGTVDVIGWEKNEVSVEAVKSAPTAEDLARIHIKIESAPERLSITSEYDKKWYLVGSWRGEVKYTVHVPAGATLGEISVINADLSLREVKGPVFLKTLNGRIEATGVAAKGRFETINGSIVVHYAQLAGVDTISLRTVNGECSLTLPKGSAFSLNSKSVNGGVRTDGALKIEKTGLGRFVGRTGEGGPAIDFESVNGALAIRDQP